MSMRSLAQQLLSALARDTPAFNDEQISSPELRPSASPSLDAGGISTEPNHRNASGEARPKSPEFRLLMVGIMIGILLSVTAWYTITYQVTGQRELQPGPGINPSAPPISDSTGNSSATAAAILNEMVAADQPVAENLVGYWVPQLMAQKIGLRVNGQVIDYASILQQVRNLKVTYPKAVLVWSGDYSSYTFSDFYVVLIAEGFTAADEANAWCDRAGLSPDNCFAKRLTH